MDALPVFFKAKRSSTERQTIRDHMSTEGPGITKRFKQIRNRQFPLQRLLQSKSVSQLRTTKTNKQAKEFQNRETVRVFNQHMVNVLQQN
jgi:hypothetical protein